MSKRKIKSHLSTSLLEKLEGKLPYGSISVISKKLRLNKSTVSRVLKGKSQNVRVIEAALSIVEQNQHDVQHFEEKIKSL